MLPDNEYMGLIICKQSHLSSTVTVDRFNINLPKTSFTTCLSRTVFVGISIKYSIVLIMGLFFLLTQIRLNFIIDVLLN